MGHKLASCDIPTVLLVLENPRWKGRDRTLSHCVHEVCCQHLGQSVVDDAANFSALCDKLQKVCESKDECAMYRSCDLPNRNNEPVVGGCSRRNWAAAGCHSLQRQQSLGAGNGGCCCQLRNAQTDGASPAAHRATHPVADTTGELNGCSHQFLPHFVAFGCSLSCCRTGFTRRDRRSSVLFGSKIHQYALRRGRGNRSRAGITLPCIVVYLMSDTAAVCTVEHCEMAPTLRRSAVRCFVDYQHTPQNVDRGD